MPKRAFLVILLLSLLIAGIWLVHAPKGEKVSPEEKIPWMRNCSGFVLSGGDDPGTNTTCVLCILGSWRWSFNLTGCAYENGTLFLKYIARGTPQPTSTFETTTCPLLYRYCIRVAPKVNVERIVVSIHGDYPLENKRVVVEPDASKECLEIELPEDHP